ncbi:MAG TPA: hypothetical protein VK864_12490, partial [Longimicrobiales bacterium]|nr:hypothetical protein [Longimicrobiales bacterium]
MKAHLLSNGRVASLVTPAGGGFVAFNQRALTRWAPDPTTDAASVIVYLRDLDRDRFWSLGAQPAGHDASRYEVSFVPGRALFERIDDQIAARLEVGVPETIAAELRAIRIANHSPHYRRIELTTYCELALNDAAADAAHPAFSKLFVQTALEGNALVAWRRPRHRDEPRLHAAHRLILTDPAATLSHETDRARFLGRGRTLARPHAMVCAGRLSGTTGSVLDPIFASRAVFGLAPGESVECALVLAGSESHAALTAILKQLGSVRAVLTAIKGEGQGNGAGIEVLGLPPEWLRGLEVKTGSWQPGVVLRPLPDQRDAQVEDQPTEATEQLRFFNGIGGFSEDGTEYVIRVERAGAALTLPPLPWINVIANEQFGCLVSERGAGYTWAGNSRLNRLTPWSNDPLVDSHGEATYLRDDESGEFWSLMPGPRPGAGEYEVRHGFGYTRFRHTARGLASDVTVFVAPSNPVKFVRVRLHNLSERARRISLFQSAQLVLGRHPADTRASIRTAIEQDGRVVFATNAERDGFGARVAFGAAIIDGPHDVSATTDRRKFLGDYGTIEYPAALASGDRLDAYTATNDDPCIAQACHAQVGAGDLLELTFLLGEAGDEAAARICMQRYSYPAAVDEALAAARARWRDLLAAVKIETPLPALDLMMNGWLTYQNLACRLWARSAFYQSGGAFGFRDQLQDAAALIYFDPAITRRQILLHAAHQFVEGDVLHWWHPPSSKGIRTRFADDLIWLPQVTAFYLQRTGDSAILDEQVRLLRAPSVPAGEEEITVVPEDTGEAVSLYEHCCRALDRSLGGGTHGLPLIGAGDWNDGMNRIGLAGQGESVWLGFFLFAVLNQFVPVCEGRGDSARVRRYRARAHELGVSLNAAGWDGAWYRRAFYDDGEPIGSSANQECRIDTIAQAWAVISRAAPEERAHTALDAMERHLVSEREGLIRLITPPFDRTLHDPGYIK